MARCPPLSLGRSVMPVAGQPLRGDFPEGCDAEERGCGLFGMRPSEPVLSEPGRAVLLFRGTSVLEVELACYFC
jgi:hypothetical protein